MTSSEEPTTRGAPGAGQDEQTGPGQGDGAAQAAEESPEAPAQESVQAQDPAPPAEQAEEAPATTGAPSDQAASDELTLADRKSVV